MDDNLRTLASKSILYMLCLGFFFVFFLEKSGMYTIV